MKIKREDFYLIVLILTEISLIIALIWFATHSEYVTHAEFLSVIGVVVGGVFTGFWSLWSSFSTKFSELSKDIGYIRGRMKISS